MAKKNDKQKYLKIASTVFSHVILSLLVLIAGFLLFYITSNL